MKRLKKSAVEDKPTVTKLSGWSTILKNIFNVEDVERQEIRLSRKVRGIGYITLFNQGLFAKGDDQVCKNENGWKICICSTD